MTENTCIVLPGGKSLRIRHLRSSEEDTVRDLYARLSPRSRYLRFLIAASELPEALLRILLDVDGRRRLAFVAEDAAREDGDAVGLASFGAVDEHSVELGLVVRDDWQRQHVGTELAIRVMEAAEDRGFHRFVANFHDENVAIRRIIAATGEVVSARRDGGVIELVFVRR